MVRGGPFKAARQFLEPQGEEIISEYCILTDNYVFADIIARVAARETPPFRPATGRRDCPEDLLELMEKSWGDNPEDRPVFEAIRGTIRCIMK